MQLFTADATLFKKIYKTSKKLPSKVADLLPKTAQN